MGIVASLPSVNKEGQGGRKLINVVRCQIVNSSLINVINVVDMRINTDKYSEIGIWKRERKQSLAMLCSCTNCTKRLSCHLHFAAGIELEGRAAGG